MNKKGLIKELKGYFSNCISIIEKKNEDYAAGSPFSNFEIVEVMISRLLTKKKNIENYAKRITEFGFIYRIMDKIMRLCTLLIQKASVTNESINDTIDDAVNYLLLLKAKLNKRKGGK